MITKAFSDQSAISPKQLLLLLALFLPLVSYAEKLSVTLLTPGLPDNTFWTEVSAFAKAVAEDLEIDLNVVTSPYHGSSYAIRRTGLKVISAAEQPDYIVTGFWTSAAIQLLNAAKERGIRVFIINTNITAREKLFVGEPRTKFVNWIGHMRPDDESAGYDLADILIDATTTQGSNAGKLNFSALYGDKFSSVSDDREAGLRRRLRHSANASLSSSFSTNWGQESAKRTTSEILQTAPETTVIWAASDFVALGAIEVLKSHNKVPGKDVLIGGFDWTDNGIKAVRSGELAATMGGHFMEAGWALVMIYDYHHDIDFKRDPGISTVTKMQAITQENIERYTSLLERRDWKKVNFRQFSKKLNPELTKYDFSLQHILNAIDSK